MNPDHLLARVQAELVCLQAILKNYTKENDNLKTLVACLEEENQTLTQRLMKEEMVAHQLRKTIWNLKETFNCNCDGVITHHPDCESQ